MKREPLTVAQGDNDGGYGCGPVGGRSREAREGWLSRGKERGRGRKGRVAVLLLVAVGCCQ